jgi:hypothetical protein
MNKGEEWALNFDERWKRDRRGKELSEVAEDETPAPVEPLTKEDLREMLSKRRKLGGEK